jgi:hypothetical protein
MTFPDNLAVFRRNPRFLICILAIWCMVGLFAGIIVGLWKGVKLGLAVGAGLAAGAFLYHLLFGAIFGFEEDTPDEEEL